MRLDVFLKSSRLLKRRPIAKKLCEQGAVALNGVPAKASREVKIGDVLVVGFSKKRVKLQVVGACESRKSPKKKQMLGYIIIEEEEKERDFS